MPRILELGLNRIFRSRWGVAVVIVGIIAAVVGIGRLFSDGNSNSPSLGIAANMSGTMWVFDRFNEAFAANTLKT